VAAARRRSGPLPLLPPVEARAYDHEVRGRVLDLIERTPADDLFTAGMVVQHEEQYGETMFATLQLRQDPAVLLERRALPPGRVVAPDRVFVDAGAFTLGVDAASEPFSLDNERPAHTADVGAFWIGRVPVSNRQWREFIGDGGYRRPELWSQRGWTHRLEAGLERPLFWTAEGTRRRFGAEEEVPAGEPVQHVCFFEAEASARWGGGGCRPRPNGRRRAPGIRPRARRPWPWGSQPPGPDLANLGGLGLRPAPVGAYPGSASAYGAEQMISDVWKWTSSDFAPWPGFKPMICRDYSLPFFGGDKVLRGDSWTVAPSTIRPSFRNWDHPVRRQIFTGMRVAWDAWVCRHLAWPGAPRQLTELVLEPEHGLLVQSYAPRRQAHGRINADGWGVGFYAAGEVQPARWRSSRPLWSDASFPSVARFPTSSCVLAAVRSATAGMPLEETVSAPFARGGWLLSHNGVADRSMLGPHPAAESVCDSAQLAAHLFDFGPGRVGDFVCDLGKRDPAARLNLLLSDGQRILTRITRPPVNSAAR
jgi:gamma-glutamyl hercynylcysteine S-oxide synthase